MIAALRIAFFGFMAVAAAGVVLGWEEHCNTGASGGALFAVVAAGTFVVLTILAIRRAIASAVEERVHRLTRKQDGAQGGTPT